MDAKRLGELDNAIQILSHNKLPYHGRVFRILTPKYANKTEAFSGNGALQASGRYNVKGIFRIAYTANTLRQAEWEFFNTSRNSGINKEDCLPLTYISADVNLTNVLDLCDRNIRRQLKITKKELITTIWGATCIETLPQAIGRISNKYGFEAILAPSSGPSYNINLLPENYLPSSTIFIVNEDRLPFV